MTYNPEDLWVLLIKLLIQIQRVDTRMLKFNFTPKGDPTDRFIPGEQVYEGITVDKEFSDGTKYKSYQIKGIQYKDNE